MMLIFLFQTMSTNVLSGAFILTSKSRSRDPFEQKETINPKIVVAAGRQQAAGTYHEQVLDAGGEGGGEGVGGEVGQRVDQLQQLPARRVVRRHALR